TRRLAGGAVEQVRAGHQRPDRQDARPHRGGIAARSRRRGDRMRRREFTALLGGAAAGRPLAARAQQRERVRRVGVLMNTAADDPIGQTRIAAFVQGLQQLGWGVGRNVEIDSRWAGGDADRIRRYAVELVALAPDVIVATGSATVAAGNPFRADRVCDYSRSGWGRVRRESGAAGN